MYPAWRAASGSDEERFWLDHPDAFDTALLNAPAAKSMRADPRFLEIAAQQGLLAYWRAKGLPDFCHGAQPEPVCSQIRRN